MHIFPEIPGINTFLVCFEEIPFLEINLNLKDLLIYALDKEKKNNMLFFQYVKHFWFGNRPIGFTGFYVLFLVVCSGLFHLQTIGNVEIK